MLNNYKSDITNSLKLLRKERALTQVNLSKILKVSQPTVSLIEEGKVSLSAEQLLLLIKKYNLDLDFFAPQKNKKNNDREAQVQNALIRFGATHLGQADTQQLSSDYSLLDKLIFEVLYYQEFNRWVSSLAPVAVKNIDTINFNTLRNQLYGLGLKTRYLWFVDCLLQAIQQRLDQDIIGHQNKLKLKKTFRKLKSELNFSTEIFFQSSDGKEFKDYEVVTSHPASKDNNYNHWKEVVTKYFLDRLEDLPLSRSNIENRDPIANKWNILTTLSHNDFYEALKRQDENY